MLFYIRQLWLLHSYKWIRLGVPLQLISIIASHVPIWSCICVMWLLFFFSFLNASIINPSFINVLVICWMLRCAVLFFIFLRINLKRLIILYSLLQQLQLPILAKCLLTLYIFFLFLSSELTIYAYDRSTNFWKPITDLMLLNYILKMLNDTKFRNVDNQG